MRSFIIIFIFFCGGGAYAQLPSEKPMNSIAPKHINVSSSATSSVSTRALPGAQKQMPVVNQAKARTRSRPQQGFADPKKLPGSQKTMKQPKRPIQAKRNAS
jgi:hypothetical protein